VDVLLRTNDPGAKLALRNISGGPHGMQFMLTASSRGFSGELSQSLESSELRQLLVGLREMHRTLQGSAELRTHGEADGATLTIDKLGRVKVDVTMVHYGDPVHRLQISFFSDQSCLPAFIQELEAAAASSGCL